MTVPAGSTQSLPPASAAGPGVNAAPADSLARRARTWLIGHGAVVAARRKAETEARAVLESAHVDTSVIALPGDGEGDADAESGAQAQSEARMEARAGGGGGGGGEESFVDRAMANPAVRSFLRSAASAAGREISRSIFGTRSRRRR